VKTLEFNGIKTILTNYINQSAELTELCVVDDHIAFDHLTIGQAKELTVKARDLQSKTDQFLKQDLYHIIGMGNLSASQSAALNKLVKDITAYRTVVKSLAALPTLPNGIAKTSTYKATTFGLKLKNKTFVKN
jgi:hypothetical protein